MKDIEKDICRIALVQAGPVMFDKAATTANAIRAVEEAAGNGAELIVFPESYIPCYPYGMTFGFTVGARTQAVREDWKRYYDNSVVVPGSETELLGEAAKKAHAYVSIGITERDEVNATLYCTNLIFTPDGILAAKHRKLKPTGAERMIWGDGYGKLSGCRNAVGRDGKFDLLGKLYAAGTGSAVCEGHFHLPGP